MASARLLHRLSGSARCSHWWWCSAAVHKLYNDGKQQREWGSGLGCQPQNHFATIYFKSVPLNPILVFLSTYNFSYWQQIGENEVFFDARNFHSMYKCLKIWVFKSLSAVSVLFPIYISGTASVWLEEWGLEQGGTCEGNYSWWRNTRKKFIFSQLFNLSSCPDTSP